MSQPPHEPGASASGQGRIFQAHRDQHIEEHHHHYPVASASEWRGPVPHSVRVPLAAELVSALRDRSELRDILFRAVADGPGGPVHVLQGMAGCGKTVLAKHVFTESVQTGDVIGLWVDASSASSLHAFMLGVAADRGATPDELEAAHRRIRPAADLVWDRLDRSPEPWLLVFDNADEPRLLQEGNWLRRSPRGTVLVTSRNTGSELWHGTLTHQVGVLPLEAAAQVLLDLAPDAGAPEDFERLAQRLDRYPLALALAGHHLRRQLLERWTASDYLERLPDDPSELLDKASQPTEGHARVRFSTTWRLSLDLLRRQDLPEALTLLRLLACFAPMPAPLPLTLLAPTALDATALPLFDPPLTGERADAALQGLIDTSLVNLIDVPGDQGRRPVLSLQTPGLLLDTVAGDIPVAALGDLLLAATALLDGALTGEPDSQDLRLIAPHALAVLRRARAQSAGSAAASKALGLVRRLRDLHYDRGEFTPALELAAHAEAFSTTVFGTGSDEAVDDSYALGRAHTGAGRFTEAEALLRAVLTTRERELGPDEPRTLDSAHALGIALYGLGRWAEDERLLRRVLAGRERLLGADAPDTLDVCAGLADALGEQGHWAEAEALARTTVERSATSSGEHHARTVVARLTHAWAVAGREAWDRAEPLARRTVDDAEPVFGPHHPRTLAARHLLATVLRRLHRLEEAESLLREVARARKDILGAAHSHTLSSLTDLAAVLTDAGRAAEAEPLATKAYEGYVRTLGPEHPRAERCYTILTAVRAVLPVSRSAHSPENTP
ncbi:tetratricopeptide repeat protein [Streptomyces sp. NPDC002643]